ncbi:HAD-IIIC family phosphatase [Dactylosporangium sp. NBC_01737]|uniref:HAD-IIIC family phosphatase n=1 Tax=Dactylosporangium sp. NBC_01737 TaxID=2975959 RepID=UPI002E14BDCA|nr:HAD-IIIC family phosphatase [Dactylosporangium sp. NBC_01737]
MGAAEDLTALHRAGRLVAEYPTVAPLLARLTEADTGAELARAGRLLARLDPDEIAAAHPGVRVVPVAVTGHGTLGPLVPLLTAELARHGLVLRAVVSDFDTYVFDLADPGSPLYRADPDVALCVLDPDVVAGELPVPWTAQDAAAVLEEKLTLLEGLAARFAGTARGTLVYNTIPLPRRIAGQLVDERSRARLGAAWRTANARLLDLVGTHPKVSVVDLDPIVAGGAAVTDPRLDAYAKAHLSDAVLAGYAREVGHLVRARLGRTRKALAVDLDNTVWGGVLGDDGIDGIEVADSYRGEAFRAFQRVVVQLGAQGIPVAAVSKNDPEPVRQALRDHPRMTLREEHLVRVVANWLPKHDNLRDLAAALNLGIDSLVFTDDSAFECGLVRAELPEVAVVALDDEPALHVERLLRDGWFDTRELTRDDIARPARYREEIDRRDFLDRFGSIEDYLRELGVAVRFDPAGPAELGRVSQLTLRTNQFNLTTERLQLADVQARAADPAQLVLAVYARDRFGDNGLVGAVLARRDGTDLHLDNAVLSCRVFSRGIEQACLAALLRHAAATGVTSVHGSYVPSPRNAVVKDLLPRYGFAVVGEDAGRTRFRHDLTTPPAVPDHVALETTLKGAAP